MFIGDVRRKLLLPWPCAWNVLVQEATAVLEENGFLRAKPDTGSIPIARYHTKREDRHGPTG